MAILFKPPPTHTHKFFEVGASAYSNLKLLELEFCIPAKGTSKAFQGEIGNGGSLRRDRW